MNLLITGTSSGIGKSLAELYLKQGHTVYGISRREPGGLDISTYRHLSQDLEDLDSLDGNLKEFLQGVRTLDLVILNAGILPDIGDMRETSLASLQKVMNVNLWANKVIIDRLASDMDEIRQVAAISSGASLKGSRGWNAYSLSKAALNMMVQLYAAEMPGVHFSAIAPGIVDTGMQETIASLEEDPRYPVVDKLKSLRSSNQMDDPDRTAFDLAGFMKIAGEQESGSYLDIRDFR